MVKLADQQIQPKEPAEAAVEAMAPRPAWTVIIRPPVKVAMEAMVPAERALAMARPHRLTVETEQRREPAVEGEIKPLLPVAPMAAMARPVSSGLVYTVPAAEAAEPVTPALPAVTEASMAAEAAERQLILQPVMAGELTVLSSSNIVP